MDNGVISLLIGPFGSTGEDVIFIGGDCFLQSFNFQGDERFWSVMSDKVTALALADYDNDGQYEVRVVPRQTGKVGRAKKNRFG